MKVLIFHLPSQAKLAKEITSLFRDEIHRDIHDEYVEIPADFNRETTYEVRNRSGDFVKYLRAAFVKTGSFDLVIKNDLETDWTYMGNLEGLKGYCFELKHKHMTSLFPGVVIMGRLVMLPEDFHQKTAVHPRSFFSLARPLDVEGVELVDYGNRESRAHAVRRVALQVKQEWRNLCHRYMGIHQLRIPDYEELSLLLNVDAEILESNELFSPDVRLDASVVEGQAVEGCLSRVVVELRNQGGRALRNIRVRVKAPVNTLASPISKVLDLVPPQTARFDLQITPRTAPCCPLEVFVDHGDEPLKIPHFPIPVHVPVAPRT